MLKVEDYIVDWPDIDYPNFIAWMRHGRERWPNRIALRYRSGKSQKFDEWSYERLFSEAEAFARVLLVAGCAKEDRVALWAENRPEWCAIWLGAVIAGCTIVPIDFLLTEDDVAAIMKKAEPRAIVVSAKKAGSLAALRSASPDCAIALTLDEDYAAAISGAVASTRLPEPGEIPPDHAASIIFTSGTTGAAKGVVLSHHGIIANINASILSLPIGKDDVFMGVLPLHHTYPTTCAFLSPLSVGGSLTICEKIIGKVIIDDARDSGGTVIIAVPLLYDKLKQGLAQGFRAKGPIVVALVSALLAVSRFFRRAFGAHAIGEVLLSGIRAQAGFGTVRLLVAGGGALDPTTADFFDDLGFNIVQGYGMSENGPLITTNTVKRKNNASAGLAVKYTEIQIRDADESRVGEIVVKSPSLMKGYFRNPEATAAAFTGDGFLKTGDLGYMDGDGFLFITGRSKNLIVTAGGKNIYPEEIEAKFAGNPAIAEMLVVPRKTQKGEEIAAVFVPDAEYLAAQYGDRAKDPAFVNSIVGEAVRRVNRNLVSYQKVSGYGIRLREFEKTSSRKIKRFIYRDFESAMDL